MRQTTFRRAFVYASAILCISGCITDLVLIYLFGHQIPGYNQLTHTLSSLGVSTSPVAREVTLWSVILGTIFILFGFGFQEIFSTLGKQTRKAFWLFILYGLGEGVASGVFRIDLVNGELTNGAVLHEVFGGIGVVALLLLPLVMRKVFTQYSFPLFFRYSGIVLAAGIISTLLFSFRIQYFKGTFLYTYCGLWQRIFLVNFYIYFVVIAVMMIQEVNRHRQIRNNSK